MNNLWFVLPLVVGGTIVAQSGLNDTIQQKHGLIYAMICNNIVFITLTSALIAIHYLGYFSGRTLDIRKIENINWWYILPGIMGAIIVGGSALSLNKLGAGKTMVLLVATQIVVGIVWDQYVKGISFTSAKLVAAVLAIISATLVIN